MRAQPPTWVQAGCSGEYVAAGMYRLVCNGWNVTHPEKEGDLVAQPDDRWLLEARAEVVPQPDALGAGDALAHAPRELLSHPGGHARHLPRHVGDRAARRAQNLAPVLLAQHTAPAQQRAEALAVTAHAPAHLGEERRRVAERALHRFEPHRRLLPGGDEALVDDAEDRVFVSARTSPRACEEQCRRLVRRVERLGGELIVITQAASVCAPPSPSSALSPALSVS